jgi:hypothetical protein
MPEPTLDERVSAIERVTALFRAERVVYLVLTTVALVLLIVSAIMLIVQKGATPATLTMLFGSSGLVTVSFARLLKMWDRALDLLSMTLSAGDKK